MPFTPSPEETTERDPLDLLTEEFAARVRRGEHPSIDGFTALHPEYADDLRRLLPAVAFLENGKRAGGDAGIRSGSRPDASRRHSSDWDVDELPFPYLGENRLIREVGRGGMGIVYEAIQEPLERRVAIKILPRQAHANRTGRQRFFREARVVAALRHPHIVPIYQVAEHDGIPYYVMPMIDGQGLDRVLAAPSKTIPADPGDRARWVAALGLQAAEALSYAHNQGFLHRDIKPANLLLDVAGTLWLADFGLAKLVGDISLTGTGDLPGTLRYLAPECFRAEADERSDLYSLGLTLYELLVGRPAFMEQDRYRLMLQVATRRAPAPRQIAPDLPEAIETIILKAMAQDPADRYQTAAALADDLRRFLDDLPIRARRTQHARRLLHWGRRNLLVVFLTATTLLLGLAAGILLYFFLKAPPHPPRDGHPPFAPRFSPPDDPRWDEFDDRPFPPPRPRRPPPPGHPPMPPPFDPLD